MAYLPCMKTPAILLCALLLLPFALPVGASAGDARSDRDIVDTAVAAGQFKTLAAALTAAGLVEALKGEGPFTVFAPTDDAFAKLPAGTVEGLLKPGARDQLTAILTYHVVPGRVLSTDLLGASSAKTLEGRPLSIGLRVGDANVVKADILCSNGVIHVIDAVLLPPAPAKVSHSATAMIQTAIERGAPLFNGGDHDGCARLYEATARMMLQLSHEDLSLVDRHDLETAMAKPAHDGSTKAWNLRYAFDRIAMNEGFEPRMEAALPEGFPAPGPLGRIVVKEYPQYRAARAEGGNSFWTLFQHIKKNDVEMTTPVEMTMNDDMREMDMAFLYEGPRQGQAGLDGAVQVLDLEPITVLSIGMRGARDQEAVLQAKAWIEERMAQDGWSRAGSWRMLGYNSPMVPAAKRYWELQVPVRR
jgi:uncharacterized surface protein with fasciclin (FAS1) repeats